jgi:poly(hydroxyalkanoate) depolymerase family esterase
VRGDRRPLTVLLALALALLVALPAGAADKAAKRGPVEKTGFLQGRLGTRAYRLYVPAVDAGPMPLVVALHGCWQTPEDFARGTRLNEAAERRHLLVLYPLQTQRENPTRCWNWFEPAQLDAGETGQLVEVVRHVMATQPVSADRVAVLGLSAGGYMAVNLVCVAPDLFTAGVGVAAGGAYRCGTGPLGAVECMRGQGLGGDAAAAACRTRMGARARPVRASLWQGDADSVVNPTNLDALVEMFRRLDALPAMPAQRLDGGVHAVWTDARGRAMLEHWLVPGMGHAWSGGDPRGTNTYPAGPDATERVLDFLLGPPGGS